MKYNIKSARKQDTGNNYYVKINNMELPYVDEILVLAIKERDKLINQLEEDFCRALNYIESENIYSAREILYNILDNIKNN